MPMPTKVRLRLIAQVNFRKSEATNYNEHDSAGTLPPRMAPGDVVCFLSKRRDQLVFVTPRTEHRLNGHPIQVLASRRLRISGGHWEPLMLQNYADEVGLEIEGLKRYEEHYRALKNAK